MKVSRPTGSRWSALEECRPSILVYFQHHSTRKELCLLTTDGFITEGHVLQRTRVVCSTVLPTHVPDRCISPHCPSQLVCGPTVPSQDSLGIFQLVQIGAAVLLTGLGRSGPSLGRTSFYTMYVTVHGFVQVHKLHGVEVHQHCMFLIWSCDVIGVASGTCDACWLRYET